MAEHRVHAFAWISGVKSHTDWRPETGACMAPGTALKCLRMVPEAMLPRFAWRPGKKVSRPPPLKDR
jgi:hypothetical protein